MDKKLKMRVQLVLVGFAISSASAVLIGWAAQDIFGLSFALAFGIALFVLLVIIGPGMFKIRLDNDGRPELDDGVNWIASTPDQRSEQSCPKKPVRLRRILLRAVLFELFGGTTAFVTFALHTRATASAGEMLALFGKELLTSTGAVSALFLLVPSVWAAICLETSHN
jgi:hypothetical protein